MSTLILIILKVHNRTQRTTMLKLCVYFEQFTPIDNTISYNGTFERTTVAYTNDTRTVNDPRLFLIHLYSFV